MAIERRLSRGQAGFVPFLAILLAHIPSFGRSDGPRDLTLGGTDGRTREAGTATGASSSGVHFTRDTGHRPTCVGYISIFDVGWTEVDLFVTGGLQP